MPERKKFGLLPISRHDLKNNTGYLYSKQEDIFKVKYIKPDGEIAALVEMTLKTIED